MAGPWEKYQKQAPASGPWSKYGATKPEQPSDQPWYVDAAQAADDMVRLAANGMTFGYADKLAGALGGEGTGAERAKSSEAMERAGTAGKVAEIGGAIATPLGLASRGVTLMRPAAQAMPGLSGLLARTGLMGIEGAGYGALTAAGNDEDIASGAGYGALGGAAGNAAGEALSAGVSKIAGALNRKPAVMSMDELRSAKDAAYKAVDDAGVTFPASSFDDLVRGMTDEMQAANLSPMRHPKAASMMEDIQNFGGSSPTLTQLDQLRQTIARDVAGANDPAERFFGQKMIQNIDEFIDASGEGADISKARDLNARLSKSQKVADALYNAEIRTGATGSGGNIDNASRQRVASLLLDKRKSRGFTADEKKAMETIATGTKGQNAARLVGKLSPQGNGLMAALGIGGAMTNPALGIPALVGIGAKAGADRATRQNIEELMRMIAAGGSRSAITPAKNAVQRFAEAKRDAVARALMGVGAYAAGR